VAECIVPENFQRCVIGVKGLAGFQEHNMTYATSSLALKIGPALQKMAGLVKRNAIQCQGEEKIKSAYYFSELCNNKNQINLTNPGLVCLLRHPAKKWIGPILHSPRCPHGAPSTNNDYLFQWKFQWFIWYTTSLFHCQFMRPFDLHKMLQ